MIKEAFTCHEPRFPLSLERCRPRAARSTTSGAEERRVEADTTPFSSRLTDSNGAISKQQRRKKWRATAGTTAGSAQQRATIE